jgi:hypothetical protein
MKSLENLHKMVELSNEESLKIEGGGLFKDLGEALGEFAAGVRNYFNCEVSGCKRTSRILGPTGNYYP